MTGIKSPSLFVRTRGRDRTGTSVTSSVFETDASTYSATWAKLSAVGTNTAAKLQKKSFNPWIANNFLRFFVTLLIVLKKIVFLHPEF